MVQIFDKTELERKDILILIPMEEELIDEKVEQILKQKIFKRYSKSHEKKIDIDKLKKKIDANIYRGGLFPR
ncbi:MAG: hypothetical protein KAX18_02220 [Candidatus Lokiarchaeota archaeon]|nr:hypothetical protein [Candidatus Lokiarchaeota archaeon]